MNTKYSGLSGKSGGRKSESSSVNKQEQPAHSTFELQEVKE